MNAIVKSTIIWIYLLSCATIVVDLLLMSIEDDFKEFLQKSKKISAEKSVPVSLALSVLVFLPVLNTKFAIGIISARIPLLFKSVRYKYRMLVLKAKLKKKAEQVKEHNKMNPMERLKSNFPEIHTELIYFFKRISSSPEEKLFFLVYNKDPEKWNEDQISILTSVIIKKRIAKQEEIDVEKIIKDLTHRGNGLQKHRSYDSSLS